MIQAKLKVNEPGDIYEQEADRVADQMMAVPAHPAIKGAPPRIQRSLKTVQWAGYGARQRRPDLGEARQAAGAGGALARTHRRGLCWCSASETTTPTAPSGTSATAAQRKWKDAWSDFGPSRFYNRTKTASFAKELLEIAERADNDIDVLNEGSALVVWFEDQGDTASADRMTVRCARASAGPLPTRCSPCPRAAYSASVRA